MHSHFSANRMVSRGRHIWIHFELIITIYLLGKFYSVHFKKLNIKRCRPISYEYTVIPAYAQANIYLADFKIYFRYRDYMCRLFYMGILYDSGVWYVDPITPVLSIEPDT